MFCNAHLIQSRELKPARLKGAEHVVKTEYQSTVFKILVLSP